MNEIEDLMVGSKITVRFDGYSGEAMPREVRTVAQVTERRLFDDRGDCWSRTRGKPWGKAEDWATAHIYPYDPSDDAVIAQQRVEFAQKHRRYAVSHYNWDIASQELVDSVYDLLPKEPRRTTP